MNIVVTGGLGFIGSHIVNKLIIDGYNVSVVDNLYSGKIEKYNPKAMLWIKDICNTVELTNIFKGADVVFHTAAMPRVPLSIEKPQETHHNNVNGTLSVLVAARDAGVKRVIYSASSSAYGQQKSLPLGEELIPNPLNPYAAQKLMGEIYCKIFSQIYGLETICLRYFNCFGDGMDFDGAYASVIGKFLKQKKEGVPLTIAGDGKQTRDFTHVSDVVCANIAAMGIDKSQATNGGIINIGSGENHSVNEIANIVGGLFINIEGRKNEARDTLAYINKAKYVLNWEPKKKFIDGIRELMKEY